jgi:hypothetical protein
VASNSGGNTTTAAYDPRQIWAMNLAPLVVAAREGAAQAVRTASRERARVRQQPAWWQQRWVVATATGLAVVGAAGAVYAVVASRRSGNRRFGESTGYGTDRTPAGSHERADGVKSTVGSGRAKVSGMARNVVHKFRGSETRDFGPEGTRMPESASTRSDESGNGLR